jgi:hypothetical protein
MLELGFSHPPTDPNNPLVMDGIIVRAIGGSPGSPLHSTSLVGIPWSMENFPASTAEWDFTNGLTTVQVTGAVDYLVPEPEVVGLAALAACAVLTAMQSVRRTGPALPLASVRQAPRSRSRHRSV